MNSVERFRRRRELRLLRAGRIDGGPGSGNFGHAGRPGKVGGSGSGGGIHNRGAMIDGEYTSQAKERKKAAQWHEIKQSEIGKIEKMQRDGVPYKIYRRSDEEKYGVGTHLAWSPEEKTYNIMSRNGRKIGKFVDPDNAFFSTHLSFGEIRVVAPNTHSSAYRLIESRQKGAFADSAFSKKRKTNASAYSEREVLAKEFMDKHAPKDLTPDEESAVRVYTSMRYDILNTGLRSGREFAHEKDAKAIDDLTKAIDRHSLKEDTMLRRRLNSLSAFGVGKIDDSKGLDWLRNRLKGGVFIDDGFVSTDTAGKSSDPVMYSMNIYAPKGTKAMYVEPFSFYSGHGERETILQRGTAFRVVDVRYADQGGIVIDVEVVGQNPRGSTEIDKKKAYNGKRRGTK